MNDAYRTPAQPLVAVAEELLRGGIRQVVICPGSRSTPLALALRAAPELECFVHLDERSAAFFALGAAIAARRPVAVLATSGTAVVNFAPAVVEARYARVPLVVLTADRPPELHGIGSPQTIDQAELYGRHAKWFAELPVPEASDEVMAETRSLVARALGAATAIPAGPVQLNVPYREPLLPDGPLSRSALDEEAQEAVTAPTLDAADLEDAVAALARSKRPIIVCGPMDVPGFATAVARLAAAAGAPILADGLSNLRAGSHDRSAVVTHYDSLLRIESFRGTHEPDFVLRFGAPTTSKVLDRLLGELDVPQLLVDDGAGWNRPHGPRLISADPVALAESVSCAVTESAPSSWTAAWRAADEAAADAIQRWLDTLGEPFEGAVASALDGAPDDALVMVGNSMPVRDIDAFMATTPRNRRMLGNRGASGIDGVLSTAFGAAVAQPRSVVAVVGDVSLIHDLNALVAARRLGIDATIILLDNDGGGIFSFLPQAAAERPDVGLPEHYEELFGTPHGLEFGPVVEALGARHQLADVDSLTETVRLATSRAGVDVLELRTDRARNVELHAEAFDAIERAVERSA